jgi:hypothetical protein
VPQPRDRSGKKTKDGTPDLYYTCVDYTRDCSQIARPVTMPLARELEALLRAELTPYWATGQPNDEMPHRARRRRARSTPSSVR